MPRPLSRLLLSSLLTLSTSVRTFSVTATGRMATTHTAVRIHEFGAPDVLKVEPVEIAPPAAGQVLVDIAAVGVNPVDTYIRSGAYAALPTLPYTPGHDAAGTVAAVGEGVTTVKPGDRVFTTRSVSGAYATRGLFSATQVGILPATLSFLQGAAIGTPYATAYRALFQRAHAKPGDTVLVHGASGAVGIAALQLCKWKGIRVMGTAGTADGLAQVSEYGPAFNHREGSVAPAVTAATDGKGPNIILEMLANENLAADMAMVAKGGTVVVIGCRGEIEVNPRLLMGKEAAVIGVTLGGADSRDWLEIFSGLAAAGISPVVGATFNGLEAAPAAHHEVIARESGKPGKVVIALE